MRAPSLIETLRRRGVASASELARDLGVSQPTISRLIRVHRDELVVLGRARAARYAARDPRSQFAAGVAVYRVGASGSVTRFGTLSPLVQGSAWEPHRSAVRWYPALPWFIEELRPQGFLGRLTSRVLADQLGIPSDARNWSSEQLLRALVAHAEDSPGDLLVGEAARERYLARLFGEPRAMPRRDYEKVIDAQLQGELPGSSAAGEQPKFACWNGTQHLLVKYSPAIRATVAGRRWADLLRSEALALQILTASGVPSARAHYVEVRGRAFLEVERFDRTPHGRLAAVTGALVDAEFVGSGHWLELSRGLASAHLLSEDDAIAMRRAHAFGGLIGNTDMHLGNVAFLTEDYERFKLAPIYDMLPMALRPTALGELPSADPPLARPTPETLDEWSFGAELAKKYLATLRREKGLDASVHTFAREREKRIDGMLLKAERLRA